MRAIIEAQGTQVPVEVNAKCRVPKLDIEVGQVVDFDKVLFLSEEDKPVIGQPYIEGASVKGEVTAHGRFDKITVFKFKKRTKYRKTTGHKQNYTEILVKAIKH